MKKKIVVTDDLIRKEKLNYYKEWRSKNKDKVKQHNQNFWRKRVEKKLEE